MTKIAKKIKTKKLKTKKLLSIQNIHKMKFFCLCMIQIMFIKVLFFNYNQDFLTYSMTSEDIDICGMLEQNNCLSK